MTRSVPISLAPVVERLELDQPELVTLKQLTKIAAELGVRTAPALIAYRLRMRGWLLSTGLSGAWEFAPGAHAGPYSRGGPLLPVRAAFALMPELSAAVALTSAAWVYGLGDRTPSQIELAVKPGESVPSGLRRKARVLNFDARLDPVQRKGVPVQRFETILVHMAARPAHVKSWGAVAEWLGDTVAEAVEADVLSELVGSPPSSTGAVGLSPSRTLAGTGSTRRGGRRHEGLVRTEKETSKAQPTVAYRRLRLAV